MRDALYHLDRSETMTLQAQIRRTLADAILSGVVPAGAPVPSTRAMAKSLGVSRNTVTLAYQSLVDDGFLTARDRSGYYVDPDGLADEETARPAQDGMPQTPCGTLDWPARFRMRPALQDNVRKPADWARYPYPFIYGQTDPDLFPIAEWRDCTRQSMTRQALEEWTGDRMTDDDPLLIEQIRTRILPRRGIVAAAEDILITLGAQNALYLLASLLVTPETRVGIEDPGYPDVRNIFALKTQRVVPIPVDREGLVADSRISAADILFVTPSHQAPTTVTMTLQRRNALLARAAKANAVIIEDDYEFETNYCGSPCPALKSLDRDGRVIYVGSLSKSLMHGLRLGFMVGPAPLIQEVRALRRLMLRHPPGNNQRTVALFLEHGHYDRLIHRMHRVYSDRWDALGTALDRHLPGWSQAPSFGGTSYWVEGPAELDANRLAKAALDAGVVIEPGGIFFADGRSGRNTFRLGFSSIRISRIEPGIARLANIVRSLSA